MLAFSRICDYLDNEASLKPWSITIADRKLHTR